MVKKKGAKSGGPKTNMKGRGSLQNVGLKGKSSKHELMKGDMGMDGLHVPSKLEKPRQGAASKPKPKVKKRASDHTLD